MGIEARFETVVNELETLGNDLMRRTETSGFTGLCDEFGLALEHGSLIVEQVNRMVRLIDRHLDDLREGGTLPEAMRLRVDQEALVALDLSGKAGEVATHHVMEASLALSRIADSAREEGRSAPEAPPDE